MFYYIVTGIVILGWFLLVENILGPWVAYRGLNQVLRSDKGILKAQAYSEYLQKEALEKVGL